MRRHFCLHQVYPSCERLLTGIAQLGDVSLQDVVNEAISFDPSDPLDYLRLTLIHISGFVGRDKDYMRLLELISTRRIWPVSDSPRANADTVDRLAAASTASHVKTGWFIADTGSHMEAFLGLVPLLTFPPESLEKVDKLLAAMFLDGRKLSRAAHSTPRFEGTVRSSAQYTKELNFRSEFIKRYASLLSPLLPALTSGRVRLPRLVPHSSDDATGAEDAKKILHQLANIEVFIADRIFQQYSVKSRGKIVTSREYHASVMLMPHEDGLKIYLENSYLETERIPEELVTRIASFAGIDRRPDGKGLFLLLVAFVESNPSRIMSTFKKADIPVLRSEDLEGNSFDWLSSGQMRLASGMMPTITLHEGLPFDINPWPGAGIPEVDEEVAFQGEHCVGYLFEKTPTCNPPLTTAF